MCVSSINFSSFYDLCVVFFGFHSIIRIYYLLSLYLMMFIVCHLVRIYVTSDIFGFHSIIRIYYLLSLYLMMFIVCHLARIYVTSDIFSHLERYLPDFRAQSTEAIE